MFSRWEYIGIHHSLTKDSKTVSWNAIRRYHTETLGWSDIGYHFGIERILDRYEILFGRNINHIGAHIRGMNKAALGICCVGNYDLVEPSKEMLRCLVYLVDWLRSMYVIPRENVIFHRDYSEKTCPGKLFDYQAFINQLNHYKGLK